MPDRREVPRYTYMGPAKLAPPAGNTLEATLASISLRGCRVNGTNVPEVGRTIHIVIEWDGREFKGDAEVTWRRSNGDAGLKFQSLDQDQLEFLRKLCATLRMEPLAPLPPEPEDQF